MNKVSIIVKDQSMSASKITEPSAECLLYNDFISDFSTDGT